MDMEYMSDVVSLEEKKTDKNPWGAMDVRVEHGRKIEGIGKVDVIVLNWYTNDGRNTWVLFVWQLNVDLCVGKVSIIKVWSKGWLFEMLPKCW